MKITFIAHSAFLVEWDKFYTLFDYVYEPDYTGTLPPLDPQKPLLVFSSHSHEDHFDGKVFGLLEQYPLTQFFVSRDTRLTERRRKWLGISDEAFEILNTMKASGIHWITYNKSHAFSAGALILSAGDMRVMAPLATAMIHGMSGGIGYKGIEEISAEVQHDVQLNDMLLDEIAKNCKTTVAKLKKMIKDSGSRDLWLMPQDALKLKLVEKIGVAALNPVMGFQLDIAEQCLKEKTK